ncbi:MAG: hypothetical protein HY951_05355 [Bacteroidia bacterium]|nr:hypothetical protein [Bacteroidia bacterium]
MQKRTSTTDLKDAIQLLEFEQTIKLELLKEQFHITYESLKPVNIIKNTIRDVVKSPNLVENVLGTVIGMATGYVSKKIFIGTSGNVFRNLLGSLIQFGVTTVVSKNSDAIKSVGQNLINSVFKKREQ